MPLLEIRNLTRSFGGLNALDRLDLDIHEGEILGVMVLTGRKDHTFQRHDGVLDRHRERSHFEEKILPASPLID
jgi:ABC-type branched-subunit amino acid transport system ATPase component